MTHKGFILIVDISGYTAYLSETELSHAQEILESLMNSLLDHIHPPIIISRVEGDGIFAYTLDNCFLQGQTLLEVLEHLYCSFAQELDYIKRNTTCTCQACARIPQLGLKIIAHYGEFGLQNIAERVDLVGTDVNLTHRLAKNTIKSTTGVSEYVFFTAPCIEALHLTDFAEKTMLSHTESYEIIGSVDGYVYDLIPVWRRDRERHRSRLTPEEVILETSLFLPVSPPIAWDYMLDPATRKSFLHADNVTTSKLNGRMMVGSEFHCAHGDMVLDQVVLDWQPFEYFTIEQTMFLPGNMKVKIRWMTTLEQDEKGTRVTSFYAKPMSSNPLAKLMMRMGWSKNKEMLINGAVSTEKIILDAIEENIKPEIPLIKVPAIV